MPRRLLIAALVGGLALTGCVPGRLLLPAAQPEAALLKQMAAEARTMPLDRVSPLCSTDEAYHERMLAMLLGLVASPAARPVSVETLQTIFNISMRSEDPTLVSVDLKAGDRDVMLAAARWCGYANNFWLYVISRQGEVWRLDSGTGRAGRLLGGDVALVEVRWLGDAWAVFTVPQPAPASGPWLEVSLVARVDGDWRVVYHSGSPQHAPLLSPAAEETVFRFGDGYRRLIVTEFAADCAAESVFGWEAGSAGGTYHLQARRALTPAACARIQAGTGPESLFDGGSP